MAAYAKQQLKAAGQAQAIVFLKPGHDHPTVRQLEHYFCQSELHAEAARAAASGDTGAKLRFADQPAPGMRYFPNLGVVYGTVGKQEWAGLSKEKGIVASLSDAPPLGLIKPTKSQAVPADSKIPWGLEYIGVPALWAAGLTGKGVRVGHLDTGIDATHPAFAGAIDQFVEFDPLGQPIPRAQGFDSAQHGTHTAGTLAGRSTAGRPIGVAPGCTLVAGIVIEGGDPVARLLAGVDWIIGQQVKILNLSLGFPGYWEAYIPMVNTLRAKGILPVIAVGNEGAGTSRSPGNYPDVISVGAIDSTGAVAPDSGSQVFDRSDDPIVPDLVMPGVSVVSADVGGGFRADDGSSSAAPHVSGLAALLWEAKPTAAVDEIEAAIYASCQLPAGGAKNRMNRGVANGPRALAALQKPAAAPATAH